MPTIEERALALVNAVGAHRYNFLGSASPDDTRRGLLDATRKLEAERAAHDATLAEFEALEAENARLREDAARYKWLRDHSCPPHNFYISVPDEFGGVRYTPDEVDTYIDYARAALGASHDADA